VVVVIIFLKQNDAVLERSFYHKMSKRLLFIITTKRNSRWTSHDCLVGWVQVVKSNQSTPILQCHGDADHLVSHGLGKMSSQLISSFNDRLHFKSYPGLDHCYSDQVLDSTTAIWIM